MIEVVRAFDGKRIAELVSDDAAALERKLATAAGLHRDRANRPKPFERLEILRRLATLLEAERERFGRLIASEGGKPLTDALVEVDRAVDGVRTGAETLRSWGGREIPMGLTRANDGRHAWTRLEPIGVVAAISAFNHPLNLIVHQVVPAIATGCPVIIKPAPTTPLNCVEFVKLVDEAGMPDGWVQTLLTDGRELPEALATDPRVAFLTFIGSARVGWYLRSKLAAGTRCALEHGGAAPVIVDETADLERAVALILKGGYYHAGQVCVSTQRIFVHKAIEKEFVERLSAGVAKLAVGDPILPETEVGPLIRPAEVERVATWIDEAVSGGAQLIGGGRLTETTLRPAIIVNPPKGSKVATLEVFGPLTCVSPYETLQDAIDEANSLPVAFHSSIFTNDLPSALLAAEGLDASAVMINDHTAFRTDWMPFAGRKTSGHGTGGIPFTMRDMTAEKMVVFKL